MNQKLKSYNTQTYIAYALIAPAAFYIILIVAWPLLETIRLSFTNSSLAGEDYVGLENYQKMFSSKKFNGIVTRTFVWMFFSVTLKRLRRATNFCLIFLCLAAELLRPKTYKCENYDARAAIIGSRGSYL